MKGPYTTNSEQALLDSLYIHFGVEYHVVKREVASRPGKDALAGESDMVDVWVEPVTQDRVSGGR